MENPKLRRVVSVFTDVSFPFAEPAYILFAHRALPAELPLTISSTFNPFSALFGMIIIGAGYDPLYEAYKDGRTVINIVDHNMDGKYEGVDIISEDSEIFNNYDKYKNEDFIVAVDKTSTREEIFENYTSEGLSMGIIDNSEVKQIDYIPEGCILMTGSFIGKSVDMSKNVKLSFRAMLNHDVEIGKSCIVAPNANLLGYAKVGRESYIGANSTICPRVEVGKNVKVGAGSTIADDTPDNVTIIGSYPVEGLYEIIPRV